MRGATSTSVASAKHLEAAPAQLGAAAPARARLDHADARRPVAQHREVEHQLALAFEAAVHERAIGLGDAVAAERLAQVEPAQLVGREQQHARGVDVEPVHDPRAQPALADARHFRVSGHQRVEQRAALARRERVHGHAGRLVEREPACALRQHDERGVRLGIRSGRGAASVGSRTATRSPDASRRPFAARPAAPAPTRTPPAASSARTWPREAPSTPARNTSRRAPASASLTRSFAPTRAHSIWLIPPDPTDTLGSSLWSPMRTPRATRIQVMDTTLRDGEQTPEVSYAPEEKLQIAKALLDDVGVDRIEVAGTRVSAGEREAARRICRWAKRAGAIQRIEMLGYCDGDLSPAWVAATGGRVLNLLVKGSEKHCRAPAAHDARAAPQARRADHPAREEAPPCRQRVPRRLVGAASPTRPSTCSR